MIRLRRLLAEPPPRWLECASCALTGGVVTLASIVGGFWWLAGAGVVATGVAARMAWDASR